MDGIFTTKLVKVDGKLKHVNDIDEEFYREFVNNVEEGEVVSIFMEVNTGDKSIDQLAKVHKIIRVLAAHIGETFQETKIMVKDQAGLCVRMQGKDLIDLKSFADASMADLNLAIRACIEIGDNVGINLR